MLLGVLMLLGGIVAPTNAWALPRAPFSAGPATKASPPSVLPSPFSPRKIKLTPWKVSQKSAKKSAPAAKAGQGFRPIGAKCDSDDQCVAESFCRISTGRCTRLYRPINIAYLFYLSGSRRFYEVLGLFWSYTGRSRYRVLFPLYWHFTGRKKQTESRVIFPFYWQFDDRVARTRTVVVPPFQYSRAPGEKNYRLWPLLFYSDYGKKGAGLTIIPFFHRSRRGTYSSTFIPFLLSGYASDPKRNFSRGLAGGLYYWHRKGWPGKPGYQRADAVVPLFYRSRGIDKAGKDETFTWAFPLNFYSRTGDRSALVIAPLFYRKSSPKRTLAVSPLFYYRRRPDKTHFFSPLFLYEHDRQAKVTHWGMLAPPYYRRRDSEVEVDSLIPLLWRWHDKIDETTTYVAGPLILRGTPRGDSQILFPLFWRIADARSGAATSVLFPLFYRRKHAGGGHFNLLFPFYYSRSNSGWSGGAFPLAFFGANDKGRHAVLLPILWHDKRGAKSTTVVGPGYYHANKKGWYAGLAPLFFFGNQQGDRHHVFFPLVWHLSSKKRRYSTLVAGPFFHTKGQYGRMTGLIPLFASGTWRGKHYTTVLPPLFYRKSDPKAGKSLMLVGPYFSEHTKTSAKHTLLPIAHYRWKKKKDGIYRRGGVLPIVYYSSSPHHKTLLTPLYGTRRDSKKGLSQGFAGPVIWHESKTAKALTVLPLFYRIRDKTAKATTTILFPLAVSHQSPRTKALVIFPLYWRVNYHDSRNLVVFPLFWQTRKKDGSGLDVLFPLYWRTFDKDGSTTVAGNLFWKRKGKHGRTFGAVPLGFYTKNERRSLLLSLPFVYYRHDFKQKRKLYVVGPGYFRRYKQGYGAGLFPLFFHKRTPERHYTLLMPIVWHFANPKDKTSFTVIGPYFKRRTKVTRSWGIAPIFYTSIDRGGGRSYALAPFFYYRKEPARSALFTPLFGYDKGAESKLYYAGPYFRERGKKRDLDGVFPLFFLSRNHLEKSTTVLTLPGYYGHWRPGRSIHIGFPLLWRFRSVDNQNTVVLPIYWDFHDRHSSRTTVVAPLFARHKDYATNTTSYLTLPGVWVRSRAEATDAVVFPLVWHFGGKLRRTTVGFPLYWDFVRGAGTRRSTVFFPLFWRFDNPETRTYVVANTWYKRDKRRKLYDFWFFPLVRVQKKRPGDIAVETLLNMFGYERVGRNRTLTLFFYPFRLSPAPPPKKQQPQAPAKTATILAPGLHSSKL
jgi:hypothetical protein